MSDVEIRFLSFVDVLELHEMQLAQYGGATGIRDSGLVRWYQVEIEDPGEELYDAMISRLAK